jgi:hypothetical protein
MGYVVFFYLRGSRSRPLCNGYIANDKATVKFAGNLAQKSHAIFDINNHLCPREVPKKEKFLHYAFHYVQFVWRNYNTRIILICFRA